MLHTTATTANAIPNIKRVADDIYIDLKKLRCVCYFLVNWKHPSYPLFRSRQYYTANHNYETYKITNDSENRKYCAITQTSISSCNVVIKNDQNHPDPQ